MRALPAYPVSPPARDRWILDRRGPKRALDPARAHACVWEEEPDAAGSAVSTAVLFLTNRECPFRCAMCDLWMDTLDATVPPGAIAGQIARGLASLPPAAQVKLYNAGSFFDPRAIPPEDDEAIAALVGDYARVIVEAHPAFLRGVHAERCLRFRERLRGRLEVAVGLETADPVTLERLNKRMTLDDVARAAAFLRQHDIDLRLFVLLHPPFMPAAHAVEWACRSVDLAAAYGAVACTVIPTRGGNGAIEAIAREQSAVGASRENSAAGMTGEGDVADSVAGSAAGRTGESGSAADDDSVAGSTARVAGERTLAAGARGADRRVLAGLERVVEHGLSSAKPMRVFADLWDVARLASCRCAPRRVERLRAMNREQRIADPVVCGYDACDAGVGDAGL
jgi:hypothetical protein